jgi:hypothetical protein
MNYLRKKLESDEIIFIDGFRNKEIEQDTYADEVKAAEVDSACDYQEDSELRE